MAYTTDLKTAIAAAIAANPDAEYNLTWKATGSYTTAESGIYIDVRSQNDGTQLVISDYPVVDDPTLSTSTVGIQFAITGSVKDTDKIKDDIFNMFQNFPSGTLGNVRIVNAFRQSGANLGQDGSGRVSRTENYYFQVHRPSSHRQ